MEPQLPLGGYQFDKIKNKNNQITTYKACLKVYKYDYSFSTEILPSKILIKHVWPDICLQNMDKKSF